jgi:hypothetical protein
MAPQVLHVPVEEETHNMSPASPSTEDCARCGGLMVGSRYIDLLDDTGQLEFTAARCVQCGDVVDPIILHNRLKHAASLASKPAQTYARVA